MESKQQNKWTSIIKQRRSYRYREQTGGGQRGECERMSEIGGGVEEAQTSSYKISEWQGRSAVWGAES